MKRVWREVVLGAVTCAAVVGGGSAAWSQEAQAPAPEAPAGPSAEPAPNAEAQLVIRRILVEGNQRIESGTVLSYLLLRPGDPFSAERLDVSLKALFATGLFADVQVLQRDADLIVRVVENPIVNQVLFEGVNSLNEDDLNEEIQAKPRSVFTAARAQADVQRIVELYRRAGRFAASVTPQVRQLDQNRVDLIFEVDEGPVTGVRSINFLGNDAFSDNDLRDAIVTQQSRWWRFFSRNDNYDPDRLEFDREQLRQFYTNRGYADFRVVSAVAELTPDRRDFYITFTIDEGVRYDFGEITVETELDKLPADVLRALIPIETGARFQGDLIEDAVDALTFAAGSAGYANVDISPRIERDRENRVVNLTFEVNEGPRVFIERIDVIGNTRTVDDVIRRELRIAEGDAFNRVLLDRSRSRVRALGFFKEVEIEERPTGQPDRTNVEVKVEEDATGELSFAVAFSSTDAFLFDVSVTERNLRGRGQFLRLRAQTSTRRQQIDLRFTEPRFLGRNLAAGVELFSLRTDFLDESSFENQSTGLGLRAGFPITDTTGMQTSYTVRQDSIDVADISCADPATALLICDQEGDFLTSVASYTFSWDRRNDPVQPTGGFDLSLSQDFAGLGGDVQYIRTEGNASVYRGLFRDVVASFSVNAGYIGAWGGDTVRINDRFFKGGSTFRGFDVAGIGPRQIVDTVTATGTSTEFLDSLGGKAYAIGTLQVEFPFGLPEEFGVRGALFTEFGTLGLLDEEDRETRTFSSDAGTPDDPSDDFTQILRVEDEASLRASYGLSVFWDSPFGPVQFDFSQPFEREPYDRTETFRFSTRTRF